MNYNLQCVQSYAKISEADSNKEVGDANSVVPTHGGHYLKKSSADAGTTVQGLVWPQPYTC
jgi:hypothetical protein